MNKGNYLRILAFYITISLLDGTLRMAAIQLCIILRLAALALVDSCSKNPNDPSSDPVWIALNASIDGYKQIYLVDYNDPARYKRSTWNDHRNFAPKFSPNRRMVNYLDRRTMGTR